MSIHIKNVIKLYGLIYKLAVRQFVFIIGAPRVRTRDITDLQN